MNGEHKITLGHRRRAALVYLRQSTLVQVRENTESTLRQYALGERAVELGWAPTDVEVIDTDLGLSGTSTRGRDGFRHLMARLCLGEVGAIFGLEISRLGRSNADLAKLAELARLTDTLLIDADGVYDLSDFNDRLLLGLKSTMSEAELHIMAGRLQAAKRAAAERGELRTPLPVGYVYDDEGRQVIDPDSEVQAAIGDVFAVFATAGSAFGVVTAFADRRFPLRAYGGAWAGQLRWGPEPVRFFVYGAFPRSGSYRSAPFTGPVVMLTVLAWSVPRTDGFRRFRTETRAGGGSSVVGCSGPRAHRSGSLPGRCRGGVVHSIAVDVLMGGGAPGFPWLGVVLTAPPAG